MAETFSGFELAAAPGMSSIETHEGTQYVPESFAEHVESDFAPVMDADRVVEMDHEGGYL